MAPGNYAFIDILVLDGVRECFVAGDALAILSPSLDRIIWANGDGARLFGQDDVAGAAGAPTRLSPAAQRQIRATPDFPHLERERHVLVRLPQGVAGFMARSIVLPRGEVGILLAAPPGREPVASDLIGGIAQPGHFVALLDGEGEVLAGSEDFHEFDMADELLQALAELSQVAPERLVKRIVRSAGVDLPVGVARISDEPTRHLLIAVDEATSRLQDELDGLDELDELDDEDDAAQPGVAVDASPPQALADAAEPHEIPVPATEAAATPADAALAQEPEAAVQDAAPPSPDEPAPAVAGADAPDGAPVAESETPETVPADEPTPADASLNTALRSVDLAEVRSRPPLRFAWKTDSQGRFSAVSPEFATAFGPAGDILGQAFSDVSLRIGIDTDGEIASLLERRDTWSGRSVMWPLAAADLRVPVDLAALPVYARDRSFEGFRGFGVARFADVRGAASPAPPVAPNETATSAPVENTVTQVEPNADERAETTTTPGDPFEGEIPALKITPQPSRRTADKVIRLAEHRASDAGLTPVERNAFREIGNKLRRTQDDETARLLPAPPTAPGESAAVETSPAEAVSPGVREEEATPFAATAGADPASGEPEATATSADEAPGASVVASPEPVAAPSAWEAGSEDAPPDDTEAATFDIGSEPVPAESGPIGTMADDAEGHSATQEDVDTTAAGDDRSVDIGRPLDTTEVAILSRLPVPILIHAGDTLHYANEEFLALTGYSDLAQLEFQGGLGSLFADRYDDDMEDGGDHALRLRTADGAIFPIDALLRSVPWRGGHALMLVVRRAGDLPEVPAADSDRVEGMKAHIAELRAMIDTATDGVIVVAPDGTIRSISRPAEALFGHDGDEIAGRPFTELFAIESQRAARDYLSSLSDHGVASVLNDGREVIGREAQGRFIPLFLSMGRLPNDSGYCAVVRDITPWKRAEEELTKARAMAERASSQKSDFLARISHEIRTPLNAIIGFSELMVDERFGPVGNDRYRDYLRDINRSGNHVLDLVNDLLDISKIEAGEQEMTYEAVSLNETLSQTVAMMQPQANRERVIIRSSFASRLPDVVADLRSVRQIALNLLSNAVRYTQAGGQVIVSTAYEPSGDVVMRVRDTGIGMSNAEIDQAMKPFKQISTLRGTRADGTGLGLPLTKAMVEANRARFSIASTPGEGTLVEVTFPATRVLAE